MDQYTNFVKKIQIIRYLLTPLLKSSHKTYPFQSIASAIIEIDILKGLELLTWNIFWSQDAFISYKINQCITKFLKERNYFENLTFILIAVNYNRLTHSHWSPFTQLTNYNLFKDATYLIVLQKNKTWNGKLVI